MIKTLSYELKQVDCLLYSLGEKITAWPFGLALQS